MAGGKCSPSCWGDQFSQSASSRSRIGFGLAPMIDFTSSPFWYTFRVGIEVMP